MTFVLVTVSNQLIAQCGNCPANAQCGCINCSPCNSGSFSVMCVCYPVQGKVTCSTQSGDCMLHQCAGCTSVSSTQSCQTYTGCSGMNCPTDGCTNLPGMSAVAISTQISDSQVIPDGDQTWRLRYSIKNLSTKSLRTVVTEWTLRSLENGEEIKFKRAVDSWIQARRVAGPLGTGGDDLNLRVSGRKGFEVSNITVLYAEYDDGTIEGSAANCVRKSFKERRSAIANAAKKIQAKLRSGTSIEDIRKELSLDENLQYILIETVGGQSLEQIGAVASRIANQLL